MSGIHWVRKLCRVDIEDVSFTMDKKERRVEIESISYGNYDSSVKRRLLVSIGLFFRIYYKGAYSVSQPPCASVLTEGQPTGLTLCTKCAIFRGPQGQLKAYFRYLKRGLKYLFEFGNSSGEVGFHGLH
ncbi:hypothetical protein Adt_06242 [Abeliophyllum distichum]|uniref:Uncharacterized protein n=1 Tax=Abeliophyllum distichum TaxID=126358 RepID=A0ABD1V6B9_9LAMI